MERKDIDAVLREIALLKGRRAAMDDLLTERYKQVEAVLKEWGVTKYEMGEGEEEKIRARLKTSTRLELVGPDKLLDYVGDPLQFARVILDVVAVPRKIIKALKELGIEADKLFQKKKNKPYLEVTTKCRAMQEARQEANKELLVEVEELRKALSKAVARKGAEKFLLTPEAPKALDGGDVC